MKKFLGLLSCGPGGGCDQNSNVVSPSVRTTASRGKAERYTVTVGGQVWDSGDDPGKWVRFPKITVTVPRGSWERIHQNPRWFAKFVYDSYHRHFDAPPTEDGLQRAINLIAANWEPGETWSEVEWMDYFNTVGPPHATLNATRRSRSPTKRAGGGTPRLPRKRVTRKPQRKPSQPSTSTRKTASTAITKRRRV